MTVPAKPFKLRTVTVVVFPVEPRITPKEVGLAVRLKLGEVMVTVIVVVWDGPSVPFVPVTVIV